MAFFIVLIAAENTFSYSFHRCVSAEASRQTADVAHYYGDHVPKVIARLICTLRFIDTHRAWLAFYGCVTYRSATSDRMHHTAFVYFISRDRSLLPPDYTEGGRLPQAIYPDEGSYIHDRIVLTPNWRGWTAD